MIYGMTTMMTMIVIGKGTLLIKSAAQTGGAFVVGRLICGDWLKCG